MGKEQREFKRAELRMPVQYHLAGGFTSLWQQGFLLNHVISEELPAQADGKRFSNSDPITGQAAWYDVRVRIYKAEEGEPEQTSPQFEPMKKYPGMKEHPSLLAYFGGGKKKGGAK